MENDIPIGFFKKLLWRFRYQIRKFEFLTWHPDTVCESFENLYYRKRIAEIQGEIDGLNKKLALCNFDEKMKQYTEDSLRIFKASLAKKYHKAKHARVYTASDLKCKASEFTDDYPVILSTTYSLTSSLSPDYLYDYVIIDEASQVDLATGTLALSCAKKAVIVGDRLSSDILGGINAGIKTCWFNPKRLPGRADIPADYEIHALSELPELLEKI